MTEITTVAELEALPVGATVTDREGDRWTKDDRSTWSLRGRPLNPPETALFIVAQYGPFQIVAPVVLPELRMTRCCGHDCHTTALLPPGSTFLCPDHGDSSNTIIKGDPE